MYYYSLNVGHRYIALEEDKNNGYVTPKIISNHSWDRYNTGMNGATDHYYRMNETTRWLHVLMKYRVQSLGLTTWHDKCVGCTCTQRRENPINQGGTSDREKKVVNSLPSVKLSEWVSQE